MNCQMAEETGMTEASCAVRCYHAPDKAHVICCNDSVEHVHLGTEDQAQQKLEELARAYFDRNPAHWRDLARFYRSSSDRLRDDGKFEISDEEVYKAYRQQLYWHIHTTEVST